MFPRSYGAEGANGYILVLPDLEDAYEDVFDRKSPKEIG